MLPRLDPAGSPRVGAPPQASPRGGRGEALQELSRLFDETLAVRLYSGPAYQVINGWLPQPQINHSAFNTRGWIHRSAGLLRRS